MSAEGLGKKRIEQLLFLFSVIFRKVINLQVRGCVTAVSHEQCSLAL